MGEKPSPEGKQEPNLELPQLRLPTFRRRKVRRTDPAAEAGPEPLPLADPEPAADATAEPVPVTAAEPEPVTDGKPLDPQPEPEPTDAVDAHPDRGVPAQRSSGLRRKFRTRRRTFSGARTKPALPGPVAAAVAGVVAGAAGTGTTYGGLRGCEAVNGTPSCGAPGLGYLVAIAIGMVALGALLLRAFRAREPLGTSFLGVGVVVVVVLVGLTGVIFSAWMFLAIPLLTAAAYVLAHWVTTQFAEPVEPPPGPDVR